MPHVQVAISEKAFQGLFSRFRDSFTLNTSGSTGGRFRLSWNVGARLEGGSVELEADGILLSELDVLFNPLTLGFGIDIPEVCVGGFCIIPNPFGGCLVRAPRLCVFSANPDISFSVPLGGLIRSEISGKVQARSQLDLNPGQVPGMSDLDAEDAGVPHHWNLYLDPVWLDIDPLDIADMVGDRLDNAIENVVDGLLGWLPGWARDLIKAILGSLVSLVRAILDIGDDIIEWLSNVLGVSIGLLNTILTAVADALANKSPVFGFENPFPVLKAEGNLNPVKIPILDLAVTHTAAELQLTADVGG